MISTNGWNKYCIWEHSATVKELYTKRCRLQAEEMVCASQAAELLAPQVKTGDQLLDAGCGSGYFYHSLVARNIPVDYWGIDSAKSLIKIGQSILPKHGLPPKHLVHGRFEDLDTEVDHVVCMNVLSNIDNYPRPLERLLLSARKTVILRESVARTRSYLYVTDKYLDPGVNLKVHVNTYQESEFIEFIRSYGFEVESFIDRRTKGEPELIIGYPHHWKFFRATKT
jgi:cyclopropane fatty-acyl-phospholipid synthase-like methyltransferase